jgi:hypothetical protein
MHLVSTTVDGTFSINPHSCLGRVTLQQTGEIVGGTGLFAKCHRQLYGDGHRPSAVARNPNGSSSFEQPALHEVDRISSSGTLSF